MREISRRLDHPALYIPRLSGKKTRMLACSMDPRRAGLVVPRFASGVRIRL